MAATRGTTSSWKPSASLVALICTTCSIAVYLNTLNCGFCFDDFSAITKNFDLHPEAPWSNLIWNDFWGTPIQQEGSHKSYRPLCVLTFRLNYMIHQLQPMGYHLVNVLLHGLVCCIFVLMSYKVVFWRFSDSYIPLLVCGLSFAVHPIHTEAVAGVVGRAECLSSIFFLLSFISYRQFVTSTTPTVLSVSMLLLSLLLCLCSMLSKEQGITVLAVCLCYEYFITNKNTLKSTLSLLKGLTHGHVSSWFRYFLLHSLVLVAFLVSVMIVRVKIMKAELPVFTIHDNPAVNQPTPYRQLHWLHLIFQNVWLLLNPSFLCADWTMGTVPLIQSIIDPRNVLTLVTFSVIFRLGFWSIDSTGPYRQGVLIGLLFLVFPFFPASNLLFPVGFVIAERILYIPSMGYAILLGVGFGKILSVESSFIKLVAKFGIAYLLIVHTVKTLDRNMNWRTNLELFESAVKINSQNAKLYSNLGHEYEQLENYTSAEEMYRYACQIQPDDIGAFINLGRIMKLQKRPMEAEMAYRKAINMMPKGKKVRVAPPHINVFFNLANLIRDDPNRHDEAYNLYKKAVSMKPHFLEAYLNMGDLLLKQNKTDEAKETFAKAVESNPRYADAHFNLGTTYIKLGEEEMAEKSYRRALSVDPLHKLSMFNLAMLLYERREKENILEAKDWFIKLTSIDPSDEKIYFQLGMLHTDLNDLTSGKTWFRKAVDLVPSYRAALYNLGFLNFKENNLDEALKYLSQLRQYHPDHTKGMQLLGDTYMHRKRFEEAKETYLLCLQSDPQHVIATHNLGVAMTELGDFVEAVRLFSRTIELDPNHEAAKKHLRGAEKKLTQLRQNKK